MISRRDALAAGAALLSTACTAPLVGAARAAQVGGAQPRRFRLANGRTLAYCEFGDRAGLPVFYFHGTPGSRLEPGLIDAEARAAGVHIIAVDRPGIGCSSYQPGRRICDWPSDVAQLADGLGYAGTAFGVVGFSGGTPYALACARVIPHRLTHVAVVSGHGPLDAPGGNTGSEDRVMGLITRRPRLSRMGLEFVSRRLDRRPDKVARRVMKNWAEVDRQLVLCNPSYYQFLIDNLDEAIRRGVEGILADVRLLACNWGYSLSEIQGVNVSLWQGECDTIADPVTARYFHNQIAGSQLHIDPRAAHITMFKWHAEEILSRFAI